MKLTSGKPLRYEGQWVQRTYDAGAIVVNKSGRAYVCKADGTSTNPNYTLPAASPFGAAAPRWIELGTVGAMPTTVTHIWNPKDACYPCGDEAEMSEPTTVCGDCWKDADYLNAFRADRHLFIIREPGL